mgnify:FL=1
MIGNDGTRLSISFLVYSTFEPARGLTGSVALKRRILPFCFLLGLFLLFSLSSSGSAAPPAGRRAVVLFLDRIGLADLARPDLPNFSWCLRHGAVGLMNTRTAGVFTSECTYVTLGAGSRAVGGPSTGAAYAAMDPLENGTAADALWRNTGHRPRPENLVLPGVAEIAAQNALEDHPVHPGLLGDSLHRAGLSTCALGNADTPEGPGRYVVAFAMDGRGIVDLGEVGQHLLRADAAWPFGLRTDYDALAAAFARYLPRAALIAVELGDTTRLDAYGAYLLPEREAVLRHRALRAADAFLGRIRRELDLGRTLLVITSPTPGLRAQERGYIMTPLIVVGPGFAPGRLFSATTRRPGIVTNMDLAPTILAFLGLPIPPEAAGRPLESRPEHGALAELRAEEDRLTTAALWGQPLLRFLTVLLDAVFILCSLYLLWPELPGARLLQGVLLVVAALPLALLLAPLPRQPGLFLPCLAGVATVLSAVLFALPRRDFFPLFLLYLATALAIVLDQLAGAPLARRSLLSYSPLAGSRFYGLGNEYMGVLLGAGLMAAGMAFARWEGRRWLLPAVLASFGSLALIVGAPGLGTNVGGFLAAAVGFGAAGLSFAKRKPSLRGVLSSLGGAFAFLLLLAILDSLRDPSLQTHLGRLVMAIRQGGLGPLWEVARRKLAMNLKLVRFSGWSRVVLFSLAGMVATAVIPAGRGRRVARGAPSLVKAIWACLAAALGAFAFNDSGIVAAGTLLVFPTTAWLYLLLAERDAS